MTEMIFDGVFLSAAAGCFVIAVLFANVAVMVLKARRRPADRGTADT